MIIIPTTQLRPWWREYNQIWGIVVSDTLGFWAIGDEGCFVLRDLIDREDHWVAKTAGMTVIKFAKADQIDKRPER